MKTLRLVLVFAVIAASLLALAWVGELISAEVALDIGGKAAWAIVILGLAGLLVGRFLNTASDSNKDSAPKSGPGPKF